MTTLAVSFLYKLNQHPPAHYDSEPQLGYQPSTLVTYLVNPPTSPPSPIPNY